MKIEIFLQISEDYDEVEHCNELEPKWQRIKPKL